MTSKGIGYLRGRVEGSKQLIGLHGGHLAAQRPPHQARHEAAARLKQKEHVLAKVL